MAITENFAGIFIPIVLLSLYYLFKDEKKKFYIAFIIGYAGLIFSHYIIAMYFSIFVFIILLIYIDKLFKEKRVLRLILGTLAVIIIVLPSIVIFLEHYNLDYLVYKDNYVTNLALVEGNILELKEYIIPEESYDWTIPYYIYGSVILLCVFSIVVLIRKHRREDILNVLLIAFCIFMMSFKGIWKLLPEMFYNIQFPWRMELILAVFIAILAPKFMERFNSKILFGVSILICIIPSVFLINKLDKRIYHRDNTVIELERGTGNLSEYYPNEYLNNKSYYSRKAGIDIIEGTGEAVIIKNEGKELEFLIKNSKNMKIELPKIYYKGYKLTKYENKDKSKEIKSEFELERGEKGLIEVKLEEGTYKLKYTGTFSYNLTRIIRGIAVITSIIACIILNIKKVKKVDKKSTP
ncbi:MAG: YfhO family protein [Clostridia bacterium]|jgi:hypothetical protein|nr:YfhO family protein [Clostridia bacterium]